MRVSQVKFVVSVIDGNSFVVDLLADFEDGEGIRVAEGPWADVSVRTDEDVGVDHIADLGGEAEEHVFGGGGEDC